LVADERDRLEGTFAPFSRASLSPIAIACFRLVTLRPDPLFNVPFFLRRMADSTVFDAAFPYFAICTPPARGSCKACADSFIRIRDRRRAHELRYDRWMSSLSAFRPRGVVFDLDGTLTDNMPWHTEAFAAFLRRHGLPALTMAMRERIDGKKNAEIFPILFGRDVTLEETQRFEDEKEGAYRELSRDRLRPLDGVVTLLDRLAAKGIGVAVATSAPEKNVTYTLNAIGLADRLSLVVRSDAVPRGKPHPDVFLHAAERLGVPAESCLAFEDAPVGVIAAVRAGMRCAAITSSFAADTFTAGASAADAAYPDFQAYLDGDGRWLENGRA
jgi:HAD superfamily hydrolase (TIGR01509 family)